MRAKKRPETGQRSLPDPTRQTAARAQPAAGSMSAQVVASLQRTVGNAAVARMIAERRGTGRGHEQAAPRPAVHDVLRSAGQPLGERLRTEMEARFGGVDFSDVRVHSDVAAGHSAREIGARAYASGSHIVVGEGGADKHTLAHELTHVVQQRRGPVAGTDNGHGLRVSDPSDRFEREAEATARRVMSEPVSEHRHTDGRAPARSAAHPQAAQTHHVQRAPGSSSDEFGDDGVTEQDFRDGSRARFITLLYGEFDRSNQWDLSGTQGRDNTITHFTASKRPKKRSRPRSFSETPEVKELRRVSIAVKTYLQNQKLNPVEVQAAIGTHGGLLVAANDARSNEHMQGLFTRASGAQVLGTMIEDTRQKGLPTEPRNQEAIHGRGIRQHTKVKPQASSPLNLPALQGALATGVTVATDGEPGLHAERRIAARNGGVTPDHLGGTKRPCPSCAAALYPKGNPDVHPGIFRSDDVSNIGFPEYDHGDLGSEETRARSMFQKINSVVENTYVTVTKRGVEVPEMGSESESDPE
ncbi:DUF4157 domain-containing protein [Streptomyces sp. NPDC101249]|uniref:eCIS core domain-containing protein n=1 Tax=Streptomyces sp. NPDC101249 TaxID=3366140 RepID=UPI003801B3ED